MVVILLRVVEIDTLVLVQNAFDYLVVTTRQLLSYKYLSAS